MTTLISIQHTPRFDGSYTIFELCDGRAQAYMSGDYKKESTAKAQVTRRFNTHMYEEGSKIVTAEEMQAEIERRNQPVQEQVVEKVEASPEAQPTNEFEAHPHMPLKTFAEMVNEQVISVPEPIDASTLQQAQAIDEAYKAYVALFHGNAPIEEQQAQFNVYQELVETYKRNQVDVSQEAQPIIKAPDAFQDAWDGLQGVPSHVERSLENKPGICDQCGHPDTFLYPVHLPEYTEWYCGSCYELHVICHVKRSVDRYESENYQEGKLQPVSL